MIGDPNWVGKTVLAQAQIDEVDIYGQCPPPVEPCFRGALDGVTSTKSGVVFGWRDASADDGVQFNDGTGYRSKLPAKSACSCSLSLPTRSSTSARHAPVSTRPQ
jgi:hypothetical protein